MSRTDDWICIIPDDLVDRTDTMAIVLPEEMWREVLATTSSLEIRQLIEEQL